MPPKGFKKPAPTRCLFCGQLLPAIALKGVLRQLGEARAELDRPRPDGADRERFARLQLLNIRGVLDILIEDEATFCFGHEVKMPKAKPPADPRGPEGTVEQRKKPGRKPKLQAVPDA